MGLLMSRGEPRHGRTTRRLMNGKTKHNGLVPCSLHHSTAAYGTCTVPKIPVATWDVACLCSSPRQGIPQDACAALASIAAARQACFMRLPLRCAHQWLTLFPSLLFPCFNPPQLPSSPMRGLPWPLFVGSASAPACWPDLVTGIKHLLFLNLDSWLNLRLCHNIRS